MALKFIIKLMFGEDVSPLFKQYTIENKLCDYITGQPGGNHAVSKVSDLILGLTGQFGQVLKERTAFSEFYTNYLKQRNIPESKMFTVKDGVICDA